MFNHILLAADDANQARTAARMAGETARQMHSASLRIVVAYPSVPDFIGSPEAEHEIAARLTHAEALAESLRQEVGIIPGELQTELLEGSAENAALAASRTQESDLIVMGSRTDGFLGRLAAWFRNARMAHRVHCPVLIVS